MLLGNLALAEMRLQGQPDKMPEIQTAKQATLQAQSLVQQLLTFARGGAPIKRPISMAELVKAFFHNHSRMNHVNYLVEVQEDLPQVAVDPNQVRRLLGNLVRNAEQALPRGGEIIVRCEGARSLDALSRMKRWRNWARPAPASSSKCATTATASLRSICRTFSSPISARAKRTTPPASA